MPMIHFRRVNPATLLFHYPVRPVHPALPIIPSIAIIIIAYPQLQKVLFRQPFQQQTYFLVIYTQNYHQKNRRKEP